MIFLLVLCTIAPIHSMEESSSKKNYDNLTPNVLSLLDKPVAQEAWLKRVKAASLEKQQEIIPITSMFFTLQNNAKLLSHQQKKNLAYVIAKKNTMYDHYAIRVGVKKKELDINKIVKIVNQLIPLHDKMIQYLEHGLVNEDTITQGEVIHFQQWLVALKNQEARLP